jgi:hypothetical protein
MADQRSTTQGNISDQNTSPEPLTRSTFISPDHIKNAATNATMFVLSADGLGVDEVSTPDTSERAESFQLDIVWASVTTNVLFYISTDRLDSYPQTSSWIQTS